MMTEQMIRQYVAGRIARLRALPDPARRAALANLRRGIGRVPGDLPELWGSFLEGLPEEMQSKNGRPTPAEWAVYLALTLYALHQQSQQAEMNRPGASLGGAVRLLTGQDREPETGGAFRRFRALATASSMQEVSHHLRGLIQLLRPKAIALDYPQLAADLYLLQFAQAAPRVRLRWGEAYYHTPLTEEQDSGKESHDE